MARAGQKLALILLCCFGRTLIALNRRVLSKFLSLSLLIYYNFSTAVIELRVVGWELLRRIIVRHLHIVPFHLAGSRLVSVSYFLLVKQTLRLLLELVVIFAGLSFAGGED